MLDWLHQEDKQDLASICTHSYSSSSQNDNRHHCQNKEAYVLNEDWEISLKLLESSLIGII